MIADRQSTRFDGTKEEWDKVYYLKEDDVVIGFAGSSEGSRHLIQQVKLGEKKVRFPDKYKTAYDNLFKLSKPTNYLNIEALYITRENGFPEFFKMNEDVNSFLPLKKPAAIGTGASVIRPQLSRNTDTLSQDSAIEFGNTLIEYASRVSYEVGPPSQLGISLAVVPLNGPVEDVKVQEPEPISIDKLLYRFS